MAGQHQEPFLLGLLFVIGLGIAVICLHSMLAGCVPPATASGIQKKKSCSGCRT